MVDLSLMEGRSRKEEKRGGKRLMGWMDGWRSCLFFFFLVSSFLCLVGGAESAVWWVKVPFAKNVYGKVQPRKVCCSLWTGFLVLGEPGASERAMVAVRYVLVGALYACATCPAPCFLGSTRSVLVGDGWKRRGESVLPLGQIRASQSAKEERGGKRGW